MSKNFLTDNMADKLHLQNKVSNIEHIAMTMSHYLKKCIFCRLYYICQQGDVFCPDICPGCTELVKLLCKKLHFAELSFDSAAD